MNLAKSKHKSKFYYDQRQNIKHGKTDREYIGLCEIIEINHETHNVKIQKGEKARVVHMDLIKRSYELPRLTVNNEDEDLYVVE